MQKHRDTKKGPASGLFKKERGLLKHSPELNAIKKYLPN
jgi:hypothetical protein